MWSNLLTKFLDMLALVARKTLKKAPMLLFIVFIKSVRYISSSSNNVPFCKNSVILAPSFLGQSFHCKRNVKNFTKNEI